MNPPMPDDPQLQPPEDFATLFAGQEALRPLQVGEPVRGRVIHVTAESVFVDVGGKGEAWIDRAELVDEEGRLRVAVGGEGEGTVMSTGAGGRPSATPKA